MMGFKYLLLLLLILGVSPGAAHAQAIETPARHAILMDYESGATLFEKGADEEMPPASMSKLMTLTLLFEQLKDGRVKLDDQFQVSEHAWRVGGAGTDGSTMFASLGSSIRVEDLIRGIIVQSGNDACIIVAEALAGTEDAFAEKMTMRAKELGLKNSVFRNSTGLPDPDEHMSVRDIAILARHIIRDLSEYYHYFSETEFLWNNIRQTNRNPLLYLNVGADGLKTGHTEAAGYGLASSAMRNGQRLILVVSGLPSEKARAEESRRLLELGFREFKQYDLIAANTVVGEVPVFNGQKSTVTLVVKQPIRAVMRRSARTGMKVAVRYESPLAAPVTAGTQIGTLSVTAPGAVTLTAPIYTGADVARVGPFGQIANAVAHLIGGQMATE